MILSYGFGIIANYFIDFEIQINWICQMYNTFVHNSQREEYTRTYTAY